MTASPVKPRKLKAVVERAPGSMRVRFHTKQFGPGCFLVLWLTGWTVGCVTLAVKLATDPTIYHALFALPFWASWWFVAYQVNRMFFTHEELTLSAGGLAVGGWTRITRWQRRAPLEEVKGFEAREWMDEGVMQGALRMEMVGQPIEVFQGIERDEAAWLAHEYRELLVQLRPVGVLEAQAVAAAHVYPEVLRIADGGKGLPPTPPTDTVWARQDGYGDVGFVWRDRLSIAGVLMTGFLMVFWDCIVLLFVGALFGFFPQDRVPGRGEWWGLFVFLIPFEVIGVVFVGVFLRMVLAPVHRITWRFGRGEVERSTTWGVFTRTKKYGGAEVERLEIRDDAGGTGRGIRAVGRADFPAFRLLVVDRENQEVCSVGGLTEGEAQWIGQTVAAFWRG